ncbi:hypothetical protein [Lactiplantibacillus plantarum]|uniref:hypothetical protein n=1 Tax=Lactiplantibacillus plantarum TaxID=1590 RepID=UPI0015E7A2D0|nr:hypothetical protein [Lactiplantibacillus plantarum]USZ12019.1 hypothetical protein NHN79_13345 [Lactiplantibacillus plantarum]UVE92718.1 hypothetical protein KE630_02870 [Lactiplantibacillus plantarum]
MISLFTYHVILVQHVLERHFASQQVGLEKPLIAVVLVTHDHEVRGTFINHVLETQVVGP